MVCVVPAAGYSRIGCSYSNGTKFENEEDYRKYTSTSIVFNRAAFPYFWLQSREIRKSTSFPRMNYIKSDKTNRIKQLVHKRENKLDLVQQDVTEPLHLINEWATLTDPRAKNAKRNPQR